MHIRFDEGDRATVCVSPVEVFGSSVLASLGRTWVRDGSLLFFSRFFFVIVFWLGSISPYYFEIGLGEVGVVWLWCLSRGQIIFFYFFG